jgi:hypothetical protein
MIGKTVIFNDFLRSTHHAGRTRLIRRALQQRMGQEYMPVNARRDARVN